jgi:anthranilate synthase component 2
LIDNFDSFSFNLVDELRKRGGAVEVWRNDLAAERALQLALSAPPPRLIVLSPGPGSPREAGSCIDIVRRVAEHLAACPSDLALFGVCLGHQAIVEALGGEVGFAGEVVHGKAGRVVHDGTGLFSGLPSPMFAARYHSLAATRLPPSLRAVARLEQSELVMAVEHTEARIAGVQFHPESILTPRGGQLLDRVVAWAGSA